MIGAKAQSEIELQCIEGRGTVDDMRSDAVQFSLNGGRPGIIASDYSAGMGSPRLRGLRLKGNGDVDPVLQRNDGRVGQVEIRFLRYTPSTSSVAVAHRSTVDQENGIIIE